MIKRVIIMEIKDTYALAMEEGGEVVRIHRKKGISVGDRLYILPEDILSARHTASVIPFPAGGRPHSTHGNVRERGAIWGHLGGLAAILALMIALLLPQLSPPAYAIASFDGKAGIQVEVDRRGRILTAVSPDGSVAEEELKFLRGKCVEEAEAEIRSMCGSGSILIGFVLLDGGEADKDLAQCVQRVFSGQSVICLHGEPNDVAAAEEKALSVGRYLIGRQDDDDREETLSALSKDTLETLVQEKADWLNEDLREYLEERHEAMMEVDDPANSGNDTPGGVDAVTPVEDDPADDGDDREDEDDKNDSTDKVSGEPSDHSGADTQETETTVNKSQENDADVLEENGWETVDGEELPESFAEEDQGDESETEESEPPETSETDDSDPTTVEEKALCWSN